MRSTRTTRAIPIVTVEDAECISRMRQIESVRGRIDPSHLRFDCDRYQHPNETTSFPGARYWTARAAGWSLYRLVRR